MSKIDKAVLKGPDVFHSTSEVIFQFIERHIKLFLSVIMVAVVASLGYVGYNYLNAAKEQKALEALYAPEAELKKTETELHDARTKNKSAPAADFAKDFAPKVEKVKAQIKTHAYTKAAMVSALNLSYFLTQQKQFEAALEVLQIPTTSPGNNLLGGFWLMHRGYTLVENKQIDPAIASFQQVLSSEELKAFQPEALLKLGICYEIKGDAAKARETYEKLGREFPETEASTTAQQYLRLLELNAGKKGQS